MRIARPATKHALPGRVASSGRMARNVAAMLLSVAPADSRYSKTQLAKAVGAVPPAPRGVDPVEASLVKSVDADALAAIERLKKAVEVNSGTFNPKGVAAIADMYEPRLKALGFTTRRIDMSAVKRAPHLFAELEGTNPKAPHFLLIGHLDTIFEPTSPFQRWETLPNGMVHAPGAADMKGGNEALLASLEALQRAGLLSQMNITVVFSGDEETPGLDKDGTTATTRHDLIEAAKKADVALCFEMARGGINYLKPSKRGSSTWTIETEAKSGHSSTIFRANIGTGAIYPLSQMVGRIQNELRGDRQITINVGTITGGARLEDGQAGSDSTTVFGKDNVVPSRARAYGDIRFLDPETLAKTRATMQRIADEEIAKARTGLDPDAARALQASVVFRDRYPGMPLTPANVALFETYSNVSADLGFGKCQQLDPNDGGAADISFAAPYTKALLDGLGPTGDKIHSEDEVLDPTSLPIATKRAAVLLYRMTKAASNSAAK